MTGLTIVKSFHQNLVTMLFAETAKVTAMEEFSSQQDQHSAEITYIQGRTWNLSQGASTSALAKRLS
jgi:hypothetical protein